jgi:uncharacterized protein YvpB
MRNRTLRILLAVVIGMLLLVGIYFLPPVHSRLSWRLDALRAQVFYFLNPPDKVVFVPVGQEATLPAATATPTPSVTPSPQPTDPAQTATPSPIPTTTSTPVPQAVSLPGVIYVDQHNRWNYCGPANLSMALNFWGWKGNRDDIARAIKPGENNPGKSFIDRGKTDRNVMPYEMANFVQDNTDFNIVVRYGGDMDLIKRFIAAGFPVLIEKGYYERDYTGKISWMGHYLFVTGYDDEKGGFIVQDAYLKPGKNLLSKYPDFQEGWRSFDNLFMVVYPPDREADMYTILGQWGDPAWANQHALEIANKDTQELSGMDLYFSWFNKGTSYTNLTQYSEAASAYDKAFEIYAGLGSDDKQRPYRMLWYQTGPYKAYYFSGRYQDVIDLANVTLDTISDPVLEESLYWRGMAYQALGDKASAIEDFRRAVYLNQYFGLALDALNSLAGQ